MHFTSPNQLPTNEYQERLYQIGIHSIEEATHHGLSLLPPAETTAELGYCYGSGSIRIQYFDPIGNPIDFVRYRFINYNGKGKYRQSRRGSEIYLPLTKPTVWPEVYKDKTKPIIIVEGEFKALSTQIRVPSTTCLAIGGVDSWASDGSLLPSLRQIVWRDRPVYIAFDSDIVTKPDVQRAEYRLTSVLRAYGARVSPLRWEPEQGKGLDDFLNNGYDLLELIEKSSTKSSYNEHQYLYELLSTWGFYKEKPIRFADCEKWGMQGFHNHYANKLIERDGKYIPATQMWLRHKNRINIQNIDIDPSTESLILPNGTLNTWKGWSVEPINRSPVRWLELCKLFFADEPDQEKVFHNYMAYMVQRPWEKQFLIPVFRGARQGTGKSTLLEMPAKLLAGNGKIMGSTELDDSFNEWAVHTIYAVFNEPGEKGSHIANKMKNYATAPIITIRPMYSPPFQIKNRLNIALTTNMEYTHKICEDDRREWVIEPSTKTLGFNFKDFYENNHEDEMGRILNFYMHYDLGSYSGRDRAPLTQAKRAMVEAGLTPLEDYVRSLPSDYVIVPSLELSVLSTQYGIRCTTSAINKVAKAQGWLELRAGKRVRLYTAMERIWCHPASYKVWQKLEDDVGFIHKLRKHLEKQHGNESKV